MEPTKLKIKSQSPPTRCEICHKTDCFNPNTGSCSRCGVLVRWQETAVTMSVPASVTVERYDNELRLEQAWSMEKKEKKIDPSIIFVIAFSLIGLGSCFNSISSSSDLSVLLGNLLFSIFLELPFLGIIYVYFAYQKNITAILVNNKNLRIEHKPLPWFGEHVLRTENLEQIYLKEGSIRSYSDDQEIQLYILRAKLKNGKDIKLVGDLASKEVGHFLEQQIESYLGIVDKAIQGEVPK